VERFKQESPKLRQGFVGVEVLELQAIRERS